jgi:peptidoglycan/LPS O-acetylase OafA/YrhL
MRPHRSRGRMVLAVVFALLALSAWWQVVNDVMDRANEPAILTGWQVLVGATGAAAAWSSWKGARWAPAFALLYGVITGVMVASLVPILSLPAESRNGLWTGAALIIAFGTWSAWWLRRSLQRERAREASHIVGFD